jgi:EAL domain-containing protein (putative c-di-GMP-specific phosphodiesterase class I)/CheY-like chemotaxis protein
MGTDGNELDIGALRFLVVEDQEFQRWAVGQGLAKLGAKTVLNAGDGRTALDLFKRAIPRVDVIITDLNMPGMDGMEFIRHVGSCGMPVALIVATDPDRASLSSVETLARAYGVNLLEGITKPVTARKLAAALARYKASVATASRATSLPEPAFGLEEIVEGIGKNEFEPYFQPKINVATGRIRGVEALARWRHPVHGVIRPARFVPALEASTQLDALTMMMLGKALGCCRTWRAAGIDASVSLNLSLTSLHDVTLADRVMEGVAASAVDARHLILEVTETAAASELGKVLENLSRLRMNGCGLAIDDYGTGCSSMQQLTRIPFTELKIDQSFVRNAPARISSRAMLESSLEMSRKLGIVAVAEGVETAQEAALVQSLGCDLIQGHYVAAPMKASDFLRWAMGYRGRTQG